MKKTVFKISLAAILLLVASVFLGCIASSEKEGGLNGLYQGPLFESTTSNPQYRIVSHIVFNSNDTFIMLDYEYEKDHSAWSGEWDALVSIYKATGTYALKNDSLILVRDSSGSIEDYEWGDLSPNDQSEIAMDASSRRTAVRIRNITSSSFEIGYIESEGYVWEQWSKP